MLQTTLMKSAQLALPWSLTQRVISVSWLAYFFLSIFIIGFFWAYLFLLIPFFLGRISRPVQEWTEQTFTYTLKVLLSVQPWRLTHNFPRVQDVPRQIDGRPILYVSNHRSHIDVFGFLSLIPGVRVLAKKSLFYFPPLTAFMFATRQIYLPSGSVKGFFKAMEEVQKRLLNYERVLVFPELTRCDPGFKGLQEFNLAVFRVAKDCNAWIIPVVIKGTDAVWGRGNVGINSDVKVSYEQLPPLDTAKFNSVKEILITVRERMGERL